MRKTFAVSGNKLAKLQNESYSVKKWPKVEKRNIHIIRNANTIPPLIITMNILKYLKKKHLFSITENEILHNPLD